MLYGDIIIYKNGKSWFSKLQHFFTGMPFNHTSHYLGFACNHHWQFEAVERVGAHRFFTPFDAVIFRPIASEENIQDSIDFIIDEFDKKIYGFTQLLTFLRRWFFGLLGKDTRHWKIFLTKGTICSEITWHYIHFISLREQWQDVLDYLTEWNSNGFHAGDAYAVLSTFPDKFKLIF